MNQDKSLGNMVCPRCGTRGRVEVDPEFGDYECLECKTVSDPDAWFSAAPGQEWTNPEPDPSSKPGNSGQDRPTRIGGMYCPDCGAWFNLTIKPSPNVVIVEIVNRPSGRVHYRRPVDRVILEAIKNPEYDIRIAQDNRPTTASPDGV